MSFSNLQALSNAIQQAFTTGKPCRMPKLSKQELDLLLWLLSK